jgi:N-acetylglucosamine malate deacetylase 2
MQNPIAVVFLMLFLFVTASANEKTILVVVAHPDDEAAIGSMLVNQSRLRNKVFVIFATDGQSGTRVTNIPEGDALGKVRQQESICALEKMGLQPPIFLSIDRLDTRNGVRSYLDGHHKLLTSLKGKISAIDPDLIITFGPDGDSHHSEHIVIGSAVTELLLREKWVDKYPLYYMAWTKQPDDDDSLGYVDKQYLNVKVEYSQEDEDKALIATRCYVSQFTSEEMQKEEERQKKETDNTSYFRRFYVKKGMRKGF